MKVDPKCETENKKDPPDLLCERVDLKSVSVDSKARNNQQAEMSGGIIEQPGRGYVKFSVPYLREHLMEREQAVLRSLGIFKSSKKSPVFFFF
jgi:hypothetical protein